MSRPKFLIVPSGKLLLLGDCVNLLELDLNFSTNSELMQNVSRLNGNFHLFYYNSSERKFFAYNSLWGLIPIYYSKIGDELIFSGSLSRIRSHTKFYDLNKKYLLQSIIFNYSLCDDTFWQNISVLPVNSFMQVEQDLTHTLKCYFNIDDYYVDNPVSGKITLDNLSDLFISETAKWFPNERFALSFTGGFDSRTLVSIANSLGNNFFTYSFGSMESTDLIFPKQQSVQLSLEFSEILLGESYAEGYFREHFLDIVFNSDGMAGINRSHYNFAADILSKKTRFILTGNFGSEILRSLHIAGALFSKAMYYVIKYAESGQWIDRISELPEFKLLNMSEFPTEWEETISDISIWVARNYRSDKNLWLYKFILEDVLRKYFGPEIVMQSRYLINRTPFLNVSFIRELLKTKYAGAYGPFFTDNPFLRFKGQEVYAHIIKKTSEVLFTLPTNKGYRPSDILSLSGKLHLVSNFLKKKLHQDNYLDRDPFGVSAAVKSNMEQLLNVIPKSSMIDTDQIRNGLISHAAGSRNMALRVLSLLYYSNNAGKDV